MRSIITLAFIAVLTLTAAAQKADETAAIGVVNQLFAEMEAANPAGILALHTPTSDLVAIFRQKDGTTRNQSINGDSFSKMFTDKTRKMKELMYHTKA